MNSPVNTPSERLDHLFSRYLDGECSAAEAQLLEALIDEHPEVREAFEDFRSLDAAVGDALRSVMGRPAVDRTAAGNQKLHPADVRHLLRHRVGRLVALAAAACLPLAAWLYPPHRQPGPGGHTPVQAGTSWFSAATPAADTIEKVPRSYERPEVGVRDVEREYLVIPGDEPGTYMVIEVNRVRTKAVRVHQDF